MNEIDCAYFEEMNYYDDLLIDYKNYLKEQEKEQEVEYYRDLERSLNENNVEHDKAWL